MTSPTARDRFWTRPVARALTSPSAIVATGIGAAVGIVATAPLSIPFAIIGGAVGGVLGLGGRLAMAMPKNQKPVEERIDPFLVEEPWRHSIIDAIDARARMQKAIASFQDGPIKASVAGVGPQVDEAIDRCWEVAQQGNQVAIARQALRDQQARNELGRLVRSIGAGQPTDTQMRTRAALESQIAVADRLDHVLTNTSQELDLLNARLDESVTKAIELAVSNRLADATDLGADVDEIVEDLDALRSAIADINPAAVETSPPPFPGPGPLGRAGA